MGVIVVGANGAAVSRGGAENGQKLSILNETNVMFFCA